MLYSVCLLYGMSYFTNNYDTYYVIYIISYNMSYDRMYNMLYNMIYIHSRLPHPVILFIPLIL